MLVRHKAGASTKSLPLLIPVDRPTIGSPIESKSWGGAPVFDIPMITGSESDEDTTGSTKDPTPSRDSASQGIPGEDAKLEPKLRKELLKSGLTRRAAPRSPTSELPSRKVIDPFWTPSQIRLKRRGAVAKPQERYQAAQLQGTSAPPMPVYTRGYDPPDAGSGTPIFLDKRRGPRGLNHGRTLRSPYEHEPLFVNNIEAARCVLLAPHRIPLKESTSLRKKPEDCGGLFSVWGYPWLHPENTANQTQAEDLFWRWVSLKNFTVRELKELHGDRLLFYVLDQRDLRVEFAHLIAMRQLHFVTEGLKQ
ncbi:ATP-binding cassette (ABC) Superfamily [Phytophthora palmivora]|uniref:ATP-binding cassette (ABC) Superfamily n=1 Tax=Phytophthora palmivora TaxID=4796 RepID=A0A2P4WZH8_9STRA|nr:ATP-binding cassette (ABC) Superfamily [Phytophthora palmivora]